MYLDSKKNDRSKMSSDENLQSYNEKKHSPSKQPNIRKHKIEDVKEPPNIRKCQQNTQSNYLYSTAIYL